VTGTVDDCNIFNLFVPWRHAAIGKANILPANNYVSIDVEVHSFRERHPRLADSHMCCESISSNVCRSCSRYARKSAVIWTYI